MRKRNDDYLPQPLNITTNDASSYRPISERIAEHFKPTATGQRLDRLIAHFSQLQGEAVDAEWVTKFCIDQIYTDTHTPNSNTGGCRVFCKL